MASKTIVVCDLGRQSDPFVLHLYAALAEKERSLIAARTAAGLRAAKRRGTKLGMDGKSKAEGRAIASLGAQANRTAALQRLKDLKLDKHIGDALDGNRSLRAAADWLNERGIQSPGGGLWHAPSVLKAARRLALR